MSGALYSQCYVEVLPNPAILSGFFDRGIQVLSKPGERRCWVPLGNLLTAEQQREWCFLLECWCLYNNVDSRPYLPAPAQGNSHDFSSGGRGLEVALTPAQILEFLDWACAVPRHEKPVVTLSAPHLQRLRAFLADDVNAADEIRVIAALS